MGYEDFHRVRGHGRRYIGRTRMRLDVSRLDRTCPRNKQSYESSRAAEQAAEIMMEEGRVNPGCHQTATSCDTCFSWHVYNRRVFFRDVETSDVCR